MNVSSPAEGRMNIEGHVLHAAGFAEACMWIQDGECAYKLSAI